MRRGSIVPMGSIFGSFPAALLCLAFAPPLSAGGGDIPDGPDAGAVVIGVGHVWSFFRGTVDPAEGWNGPAFDDFAWEKGPTGIGYGDGDDQTVLEDMRCVEVNGGGEVEQPCADGGYLAFFARTTFAAPEIPEGMRLFAKVSYDDGFVLYVNGVRVGRVNMPDGEATSKTPALSAVGDAPSLPDAVIVIPAELLVPEGNVLAASVHNVNPWSTDASFVPRLIVGTVESPPKPDCEEMCAERAANAFHHCLEEGLGEDACAARKAAVLEECLHAECGTEPPDEPGCKELCAEKAKKALTACLEEGLPEEECVARKSAALAECLHAECGTEPPDEPGCKELCAEKAKKALTACLEEGLPEEECVARKSAVLAECLHAECGIEPPEEPGCKDLCYTKAKKAYSACLEEGLPEAECAARKSAVLAECLHAECGIEPPEEPTCESRCEEGAAKAFRLCLEEGGTEDACREKSLAALEGCRAKCGEEPPEKPCADGCAASGNAVFLACLEAGGGKEECRHRADGIVALCLERCGIGSPCETRCAVAAQVVLTGCDLAGLPAEECRAMANSILERCVGNCEPAPACEEGCTDLAARAVEECTARDGTKKECDAAGDAVLAECLAHCEGEPVPECDLQCEQKGAHLYEACIDDGKPEAECEAQRAAFLAHCGEELGEVCDREKAALLSTFQLFMRGDSNRDGSVNLTDCVDILGYLFLGTAVVTCEDAADASDDGRINMTDAVVILNYLFLGRGTIPEPRGKKGQDPTADLLLCAY